MRERIGSRRPLVALVGRANVGKSRLFNRLLRARRALVEGRPGVTRDRIAAPAQIEGRAVLLVDTGGLDPDAREGIPAAVLAQVERVLCDAAVVLFLVDVRTGLLPLDREIAARLHQASSRVVVVANKADGPQLEAQAGEFHELGFPDVIPASAEHNRGIADLELAIAERLPASPDDEVRLETGVHLAIVGRPNAGKSSLLNRLLGEEHAIVSETPGTTRDANDVRLTLGRGDAARAIVLVDTAGLRRPGRRSDHLERGSAYMVLRALERADLALLVVDAEVGVADQDAKIARLALDCGRGLVICLNKWDLLREAPQRARVMRQLARKLGFVRDPVILKVSAHTGRGTREILPRALELFDELQGSVTTAQINRVLREAVERNAPPSKGRRAARFYYATCTSQNPFTVLFFVNDLSLVTRNYRKYLESSFRKAFGLRSAPLRLRLRTRTRRDTFPGEAEKGGDARIPAAPLPAGAGRFKP